MTKLTAKQALFIKEYLIDLNATLAAIRAGYSKKTAGVMGFENLKKPNIVEEITKALAKRSEKTEITAELVLRQIQEDRQKAIELGQISVAMRGNELLGKHIGCFVDRVEIKEVSDIDKMSKEEIQKELKALEPR